MHDKYKTKSQLIEELQESRDVRTQLAEALVRTKVSLSIGDETIKRLYKENAELKAYKDVNEDFKTAWEQLKVENERLKEENYQLQKDCQICENFINFIPCKPIRDMDYDLQKVIGQRDKYIQTLQEIKNECSDKLTQKFDIKDVTKRVLAIITKEEEE